MSITRRTRIDPLADYRLDEAFDDIDQWRGRAEVAEQELAVALEDLAAVSLMLADLSVRSLPHLDSPTWPQTDQPVGPVIAEQMDAEQAAPGFKGWN